MMADSSLSTKFLMILNLVAFVLVIPCICESDDVKQGDSVQRFKVEGKVAVQSTPDDWMLNVRILVDGGQYLGLLKPDGSFAISIPSGSYIFEVAHPTYVFDLVRIEINSKGKIRARLLNNIQPSAVHTLSYPLRLKARGVAQYFEKREQWRLTDFIFSPMIMMMFVPLILMFLLPKLINSQDPDTQRDMQQSMTMLQPQQNLPDAAEMLTKWFGSGTADKKTKNKAIKKQ